MKLKLTSVLLAGVMAVLFSSCTVFPNGTQSSAADKGTTKDTTAKDAESLSRTYESDVDNMEQEVYNLSKVISKLKIQTQPISQEQKNTFSNYKNSLDSIVQKLSKMDERLSDDLKDNKLEKDNFIVIEFQISRLTDKIELLNDTLNIVYGID